MTSAGPKKAARNVRNIVFFCFPLLMIVLLLASFAARRSGEASVSPGRTAASDAVLVAEGQRVYVGQCASCHGANGQGQADWQTPLPSGAMPAPPHDASGHTWHHNDQSLFATVRQGGQANSPPGYLNNMPAFPALSDREIWAVLSYIKSTWPPDVQATQERGHE